MLQPQMPFWGLYPEQVDPLWLDLGFGLEAVLFDGNELTQENFKKFEDIIAYFSQQTVQPITLHFPMNNANYLDNLPMRDALWHFIDLASCYPVRGIVLHSNYLIPVERIAEHNFPALRERFLALYAEIDRSLHRKNLWVGIENMPIMGNLGDNADAIFVYPQDFADFHFEHVRVVFDLCHWTNTVYTVNEWLKHPQNAHLYPPMQQCAMSDFLQLEAQIVHLHLGAFKGAAIPPRLATSTEGHVPGEGTLPRRTYWDLLTPFRAAMPIGITLEIHEQDYVNRRQIWRSLSSLTHEKALKVLENKGFYANDRFQ